MKIVLSLILASTILLCFTGLSISASPSDAPRMTKEQLKGVLGNPDVIVLDMRSAPDYKASPEKIKGAVREEPGNAKALLTKYPKEKTLVLY